MGRRKKQKNPLIEVRKAPMIHPLTRAEPYPVGVTEVKESVGVDFLAQHLRLIDRYEPEEKKNLGVYIVADSQPVEGTEDWMVEWVVYCVRTGSLEWGDAPEGVDLGMRAEWAQENADFIFRDRLESVFVPKKPNLPEPHEAVVTALFPFHVWVNPEVPVRVNGDLMTYGQLCGGHRIAISYEVVTEESAAEGDVAERGWENEFGESMEPDEVDIEEGLTAIDLAAKWLFEHYAEWVGHIDWYQGPEEQNLQDGSWRTESFHLRNFTDAELKQVWVRLQEMRSPRRNPKARNNPTEFEMNLESRATIAKRILEASARAAYVSAYATRCEDLGVGDIGGDDWMDVAPDTSAAAFEWAEGLWYEIVAKNISSGLTKPTSQLGHDLTASQREGRQEREHQGAFLEGIADCWAEAAQRYLDHLHARPAKANQDWTFEDVFDDEGAQRDFGHYIAMEAMGTGVSWADDHGEHGLKIPRLDAGFDPWGIVPDVDLAQMVTYDDLEQELGPFYDEDEDDEDDEGEGFDVMESFEAARFAAANGNYAKEYAEITRVFEHLNYASAYENEGLTRARDMADILRAKARQDMEET